MADSDPISDATPNKRRKLQHSSIARNGWDPPDDEYGDDLTSEDVAAIDATQPTLPIPYNANIRRPPQHHPSRHTQFTARTERASTPATAFVTQPTQIIASPTQTTQPTQPLHSRNASTPPSDVIIPRSSPLRSPGLPSPITKAPFAKPPGRGGLLARSIGPAGTSFRPPPGIPARTHLQAINLDDSDEEPDPPIQLSDDEETQGLTSNLKPTRFTTHGRGLDSTPTRPEREGVVVETPLRNAGQSSGASNGNTVFGNLMATFEYSSTRPAAASRNGGDMASAYGSATRQPRPPQALRQTGPARAQPVAAPIKIRDLYDIEDYNLRKSVAAIRAVLGEVHSLDTIYDHLVECHGSADDAMERLAELEERSKQPDEVDELSSLTPAAKRGQAIHTTVQRTDFSDVTRRNAKQEVKAPIRSIAEKYAAPSQARKPSQAGPSQTQKVESEEDERPRKGRILQARRPNRSMSPAVSPTKGPRNGPAHRNVITIEDDEDDDDDDDHARNDSDDDRVELVAELTSFEGRLFKFFQDCDARGLADLCAQPEDVCQFVLDRRPFSSLDAIREISNVTETKSGRKSKTRPIGDKIVDVCAETMKGYEAVEELVQECEKISRPIQNALKGWGLGEPSDGELQLMKLDDAHDSGIGTPVSSCNGDSSNKNTQKSIRGKFLSQPENMGDFAMKDYQLVGLNWLNLLWSKKISCILADDMGLGKTCQVISFLAHLQLQNVDGVHLVIVPGSTLENWLREFARFAPSLKVFPYYGGQKERPELRMQIEEEFSTLDVIVTTYDMAAKPEDNKFLRRLEPAVCVFDEAHALRNPNSDRYAQLMRISSDFRILLTGTPLQNNLQELIAILAFIMPKLFQGKREELDYIFKHKATTKDTGHAALLSADRIARARTMMTPFILRRKKAQVLDLPTKHSRVDWCEMSSSQAVYYAELVDEAQRLFAESAAGATKAKTAKASSNILMALRKAAIQPLLSRRIFGDAKIDKIVAELSKHDEFGGNPPEKIRAYLTGDGPQSLKPGDFSLHTFCSERDYLQKFALKKQQWMDSGKVQRFKELVSAYHKNGDRLLVFSQFTTMMDILEAVLETLEIKFMRLDGSTRMDTRQDMIDQFTADESITVFMLSTKAGGAGINLACANKVIIFDSGFNPQDDIQAENRAHRVGQTREVEVVRLVTRGTIEEQIHMLGESKLALDERVAGEGATAAEDKQAEKSGEQMVEKLFKESIKQPKKEEEERAPNNPRDLKDAFKAGLEGAGVRVESKQAQY